jgi:hypothetical protein
MTTPGETKGSPTLDRAGPAQAQGFLNGGSEVNQVNAELLVRVNQRAFRKRENMCTKLTCSSCNDSIRISWSSNLLLANSRPLPYRMKSLALFQLSITCNTRRSALQAIPKMFY